MPRRRHSSTIAGQTGRWRHASSRSPQLSTTARPPSERRSADAARCSSAKHTKAMGRQHLVFLGGLETMAGYVEVGQATVDRAATIYLSARPDASSIASWCGPTSANIRTLAGDHAGAEEVLLERRAALRRSGDMGTLSTRAAELADALYRQCRYDEARTWIETAQTLAGDDDPTVQPIWRSVRAKLVARQGAALEAERLLSEAMALVDQTECLNRRAKVRMDLAEVFQLAGREKDRAIAGHGAIDLYLQRATERRRSRRRSCSLSHRRRSGGAHRGAPSRPSPALGPPPSASASSGKAAATSASVQSSTNSRVRSVISATSFPRTILSLSRGQNNEEPATGALRLL